MDIYSVFDREILDDRIRWPYYLSCFFLTVSVVLLACSFIATAIVYLFAVILFVSLIFIAVYMSGKKMYGYKASIKDGEMHIYSINQKLLRTLDLNKVRFARKTVILVQGGVSRQEIKKECLILYGDKEISDEIEYRSYWNNKDVLIIQNQELIHIVEDIKY